VDGGGGEAEIILHPYTVEVYLARDGSEACLSLNLSKVFAGGTAR